MRMDREREEKEKKRNGECVIRMRNKKRKSEGWMEGEKEPLAADVTK